MVSSQQELFPGRLLGGGIAVIPVYDEHRIPEVGRFLDLGKERAERKVEVSHAVVGREAVETVFCQSRRVDLCELEAGVIVGDAKGAVIPCSLDECEEGLFLVAK